MRTGNTWARACRFSAPSRGDSEPSNGVRSGGCGRWSDLAWPPLVASTLTLIAVTQRGKTEDEARVARARELAAAAVANLELDPERSILLATEAIDETRSVDGSVLPEAEEALHRAVVASRIEMSVPGIGGRVDWSPKGVFVTEGPEDSGVVDIRDAETGESVLAFHGHDGDVTDVAFSPDGSKLATTGGDGKLKVWDPETGHIVAGASGNGDVWGPSFSRDGSVVAAAWTGEGSVRVLNLVGAPKKRTITGVAQPDATALSPDGRRIAVSSGKDWHVHVFDVAGGEEVLRMEFDQCCAASNLSWSPDGRYLASGFVPRVWDATTGRLRFSLFGHTDQVLDLDWSRDSTRLVTGSYDGTARVWELAEGGAQELMSLSAQPTSIITGVSFSPDGTRVITGSADIGSTRIWDVGPSGDAEWANIPSFRAPEVPYADVQFMPLGHDLLASGTYESGDSVDRWDPTAPSGARWVGSLGHRCCVTGVGVSSDGATIAMGYLGGKVSVRDAVTGHELFGVDASEWPAFALSPDGQQLAVAEPDRDGIRIYDRSGYTVSVVDGFTPPVFSPDGRLLATATYHDVDVAANYRLRIWEWEQGEVVTTIPAGVDGPVVFDPTGMRIATTWDRRIEVWDVENGDPLIKLPYQPGDIYGLAFSLDGSLIATGAIDGTVRLFDAASGQQRLILQGPVGVGRVAFGADGALLASTSGDGTVRVWALEIDDLIAIARQNVTRLLTDEECRQYLHLEACPNRRSPAAPSALTRS